MQAQAVISLKELIAPHFYDVHRRIKQGDDDNFWLSGGRGSTKSSFPAIEIILGMMKDPQANAVAVRKVAETIRESVLEQLLWATDMLGVSDKWRKTVSPNSLVYLPTGQKIIFKGLDDATKLKSLKVRKGYFKFLWFEEGAEYDGMEEMRSVEQTVLRGGPSYVQFVTYNPPKDPDHWINKEAEKTVKGRFHHHSTYQTVPRHWLGDKFFTRAEALAENDYLAYENEYLGKPVGRQDHLVFNREKWEERASIDETGVDSFYYGADWGFSPDPTTLVRMFIDEEAKILYVTHCAYGARVELDDLPEMFKTVPGSQDYSIIADNARPETISYMNRQGFFIEGAKKGKGSVEDGIEYLRGTFKKIVIHSRCVELIQEMKEYAHKVDRHTKKVLPVLVPGHDHCIDAIRYGLEPMIKKQELFMDIV